MYEFRREAISAFARNTSVEEARAIALHAPSSEAELFGRYDYGFGDLDLSEVRFKGGARNRIREFLESPALDRHQPFSTKDEYDHVKRVLSNREDVARFNTALRTIIEMFAERFGAPKPLFAL